MNSAFIQTAGFHPNCRISSKLPDFIQTAGFHPNCRISSKLPDELFGFLYKLAVANKQRGALVQ